MKKSKLGLLLALQWKALWYSRRKKNGGSYTALIVLGGAVVIAAVFGYNMMFAQALKQIGMLPYLLGLMVTASSLVTLLTSIYKANGALFAFGDYDTLMSWPVTQRTIVLSRVWALYLYNASFNALILAPAGIVYAIMAAPAFWFYPIYIVCMMLTPVVPMILGGFISALIGWFTAGSRKKDALNIAFQILLFLVIIVAFYLVPGRNMGAGIAAIAAGVSGVYPLAMWFMRAVSEIDPASICLFVGVSAAVMAVFTLFFARVFKRVNTAMAARKEAKHYHRAKTTRARGVQNALYRMELRRLFSIPVYIVNTLFGMILLLVATVAASIFAPNILEMLRTEHADLLDFVYRLMPLVLALFVALSCTTSSAVSIEGKQRWIVKHLPVRAKEWLQGKVLVNLTCTVPIVLLCALILCIVMRMSAEQCVWMFVTPVCYAFFSALCGLAINLALPQFNWSTPASVVKQSVSALCGLLLGMFASIVPLVVTFLTGAVWIVPAASALVLLIAVCVWVRICKKGDKCMLAL